MKTSYEYAALGLQLGAQAVVLCTLVICGCGGSGAGSLVSTRDSVGVMIVESRDRLWSAGEEWQVAEEPFLEIGSTVGSPEYSFHRVEGALRLNGGRIAIADAGSGEIRFYDQAGRFLSSGGGVGDAPGEYRQITAMGAGPGDSLWVFDFGLRRFTVLTGNGEPVRAVSVGGTLSSVGAVGRLPDGYFVVKENWGSHQHGQMRQGLVRDEVAVARLAKDGTGLDTITTVAGREVSISSDGGRAVMSAPLFAHGSSAAIWDGALFVGDQKELEVRLYRPTGRLERIYRVPNAVQRLTAADVARLREEVLAAKRDEERTKMGAHLDEMDVPSAKPAYGSIVIDSTGNVWLGEYARYPALPRTWTVLSSSGMLLGEVAVPERFRVLQIGSDWIMGVGRDEWDVEFVRLYTIEKPAMKRATSW
jgi:hypothetical protein